MMASILAALPLLAASHSNLITPMPRNAIDATTDSRFGPNKFPDYSGNKGCLPYGASCGCWCQNGTAPCYAGQTCFWFSQGCTIGCPTCTGTKAREQDDKCPGRGGSKKAVICDQRLRTYNVGAECNSDKDIYKHNPWR